jgi:hypothetical protein
MIEAGTRHLPSARRTHHAVMSFHEGRSGAAHRFGHHQTKRRPACIQLIFSRSSSLLLHHEEVSISKESIRRVAPHGRIGLFGGGSRRPPCSLATAESPHTRVIITGRHDEV